MNRRDALKGLLTASPIIQSVGGLDGLTEVSSDVKMLIVCMSDKFLNDPDVELDVKSVREEIGRCMKEAGFNVPVAIFSGCRVDVVK